MTPRRDLSPCAPEVRHALDSVEERQREREEALLERVRELERELAETRTEQAGLKATLLSADKWGRIVLTTGLAVLGLGATILGIMMTHR